MKTARTSRHGDGLLFAADDSALRIQSIRVIQENGNVQLWVETLGEGISEVFAYLTAEEAMAFSKAFERCAIQALRDAVER